MADTGTEGSRSDGPQEAFDRGRTAVGLDAGGQRQLRRSDAVYRLKASLPAMSGPTG